MAERLTEAENKLVNDISDKLHILCNALQRASDQSLIVSFTITDNKIQKLEVRKPVLVEWPVREPIPAH